MKKFLSVILFPFILIGPFAFSSTAEDADDTNDEMTTTEEVVNPGGNPPAAAPGNQGNRGNSGQSEPSGGFAMSRSQIKALGKRVDEERIAFHEALRQYLLSMPDMTAGEEAVARAAFLRANFEWRVEIAQLEEVHREARASLPPPPLEPAGMAELEATVEQMRRSARSAEERQMAEAYRRVAAELIRAEEAADPQP